MEFRDVSRYYDGFRALHGVSLKVGDGEVVVLVGPNGAGKSTLLKIAAGLLLPSSGTVTIGKGEAKGEGGREGGREGKGLGPLQARREVGYLPENAALYDELTAGENLRYFCALRGLSGKALNKRADRLLKRVDLAGEERLVRQFSKGMRQRLGIAVSLAGDPRVLLWDEPSSGLDPSGRLLLRELIGELKKGGASVLISSHDLRESALLADRVCLIYKGELRFQGSADGPRLEELYREVVG